ncbi:valine--tRNA ligase [Sulfuriflexus sp.]|uniref:valine--tRNA ligase n=1 Tax=Sulfuriflexus sp. TaxID=2015443 RepID=UPI0028CF9978|nr:valine--tRNA ligase [Sulfuriflexus sp.]MDT8403630.1 valine--tRNA ligase [Sulfuriflexus sp.]
MDKTYQPNAIEQTWYETWESRGYFAAGSGTAAGAAPYCIMIPPPNVTGSLHMGHAFQDTIMDALTRYHRMRGDNTLWQAGTDHAGIATQMVVERQLAAEDKTRHDLGRDAFIKRVWDWKAESGGTITRQLRRMGASLDWSRERFTMDPELSTAVGEVFVRLHEEGLIYRGKRLVNWDPVLHTAVSDLEVLSQEENGYLWHMRYPLADGSGHVIVATTRPETMLGDAAVAVHPGDERYQHLIGQMVELPLTGRKIPIIADDYVDPEFGTGCVKITPAHDFNDYQVWQAHRDETAITALPNGGLINIFSIDACVVGADDDNGALIPADFHGLDRYVARKLVIEELGAQDLLEKTDDHKLMVPRGDRSGAVIEPFLTDQWYVRTAPLAEPAIKAVRDGDIKFVPDNWKNTYYEWMNNIEDWCISRQIWWGHRIPAWYDDKGDVYVGRSEQEVREKHGLGDDVALRQDEDVLDTWFSSALWPFATLGWPQQTDALKTYYPTSVLVTGFDIIFFWVARMIMMGLKFMDEVPFKEIYIHGLVRDSQGQKMSKSKGNVLDPLDLIDGIDLEALVAKRTSGLMQPKMAAKIEKATRKEFADGIPAFGTDALRFTFAAQASTGRDIKFDMNRIAGYRNFCNKLWNAARYVLMNTEGQDTGIDNDDVELNRFDRWIISRLQQVEAEVSHALEHYRLDHAAQAIYDFTWNEYCDWYLELSKPVLQGDDSSEAARRGTRRTLVRVLETLLRLAHPFIPYITEEIWQRVAPLAGQTGETIMLQAYPVSDKSKIDEQALAETELVMQLNRGVRRIRSEMNIAPGKALPVIVQNLSETERAVIEETAHCSLSISRMASIDFAGVDDALPESASSLVGTRGMLHIPLAGLIDKAAELNRLDKELAKTGKELAMRQQKLANRSYVDKAPETVVNKERERVTELESAAQRLQEEKKRIAEM